MDNMDEDLEENTTYTWVNFKFKTIRIVENIFSSHMNTIKAEIVSDVDTTEREISLTLDKVHFWFDQIMSNSIMFSRENSFALGVMFDPDGTPRTENFPMIFPDEPSDDNLARILHSKMNAFGAGRVEFGMIEITSDTREMLTCTFTGLGSEELPTMEQWVGERSYFEFPWWARDDGSTLDVVPAEDSDLADAPKLGYDMSFLSERYRRSGDDTAIIVRPQFKPQVISGGKNDIKPNN